MTPADTELPARFVEKIEVDPETGCWIWTGARSGEAGPWNGGYPYFWHDGRMVGAHRFAFERLEDRVVAGLHLHHTCRRRPCVFPGHLEPVFPRAHLEEHGSWTVATH